MSGGHFNYQEYNFTEIVTEIENIINNNENNGVYLLSVQTLTEFKTAIEIFNKAKIYLHRIDYLLEGDDGEDSFHKRLKEDLEIKLNE